MKVAVDDVDSLKQIEPRRLAVLLTRLGWRSAYELPSGFASVWRREEPSGERKELLVPTTARVSDYAARVKSVICEIAAQTRRSELDTLSELESVFDDRLMVKVIPLSGRSGTIPLTFGRTVLDYTGELLIATACSTISPRPHFAKKRPREAVDWFRSLRLGQTRLGSYEFVFYRELENPSDLSVQPGRVPLSEVRFERRVLGVTATALDAAVSAARKSSQTREYTPFDEGVKWGISSNLCYALANLVDPSECESVEFLFSWAATERELEVPSRVRVSSAYSEVFLAAGDHLSPRETTDLKEVAGQVVRLEKDSVTDAFGDVTIEAPIEGEIRRVRVHLKRTDYDSAAEAHVKGLLVHCIGEVFRAGNRFWMPAPTEFSTQREA